MMDCFQKACGIKFITRATWHLVFLSALQFVEEIVVSLIYLRKVCIGPPNIVCHRQISHSVATNFVLHRLLADLKRGRQPLRC